VDVEQYEIMYRVEDVHWWYRGIRRNAEMLLRRHLAPGRTYSILDAGCGTGGTTAFLANLGTVTGLDFSTEALGFAKKRGLKRITRGSIERLPFPDGAFDALTCFDVLYHRGVVDEWRALSEFKRVLKPGGVAVLREPAFDWLRGAHDVAIHTERRLTAAQLADRMAAAGFEIASSGYANMTLFPLAVLKRSLESVLPWSPADLSIPPQPVNSAFETILNIEALIAQRVPLPIGLSAVAVGRA
jgi:SAM-dependent methyltransferase